VKNSWMMDVSFSNFHFLHHLPIWNKLFNWKVPIFFRCLKNWEVARSAINDSFRATLFYKDNVNMAEQIFKRIKRRRPLRHHLQKMVQEYRLVQIRSIICLFVFCQVISVTIIRFQPQNIVFPLIWHKAILKITKYHHPTVLQHRSNCFIH